MMSSQAHRQKVEENNDQIMIIALRLVGERAIEKKKDRGEKLGDLLIRPDTSQWLVSLT